ncbi:lysylphosphatidylglycerol synthase transmembrane domain-containing protein [Aliikangiella coralliicola]|uniref:Flippase-like domain-containing protein n=1 Tax=Aliikangiella coralliicola TaxID=2592383 RepID=A0A545TSM8_9GAMM|nr:lysylphosphatidylglycerol synthase transmembrane domain-containing protein [Aliikangiella coralliicola]TQV80219.1 flippase-like domain-containing protein [Aliikangiella coralliicola]
MLRVFSNKRLKVAVKWSVLLVATGYLFIFSEFINVFSLFENIVIEFFVLFMLFSLFNRAFNAYRIKQIADILQRSNELGFFSSFRILLFSEFVSVVIPTTYSAELVRTFKLSQYNLSLKKTTLAILVDRSIGLLFLCIGTLVAFLVSNYKLANFLGEEVFHTIYLVILVTFFFLIIVIYRFRRLFSEFAFKFKQWLALDEIVKVSLVSFSSFGTGVISYYFAFVAAGVELSFVHIIFIVFMSFIGRLVPFSILGVSAGEIALVVVSEGFGVSHELALFTAMIVILSKYLFSAIGFLTEIYLDGVSVVAEHLKKAAKSI